MRTKLHLVFLIISTYTFGQENPFDVFPFSDGKVTYTNVVKVDGATKDQLYSRAKLWFVATYQSSREVIQIDDKENGKIIGKGLFNVYDPVKAAVLMDYTITMVVKDGRYKYVITDINFSDFRTERSNIESYTGRGTKRFFEYVNQQIESLIISMAKGMNTAEKPDEW